MHLDGIADLKLGLHLDRKSTRLNSSHLEISYAVFCLKKKNNYIEWFYCLGAVFGCVIPVGILPPSFAATGTHRSCSSGETSSTLLSNTSLYTVTSATD